MAKAIASVQTKKKRVPATKPNLGYAIVLKVGDTITLPNNQTATVAGESPHGIQGRLSNGRLVPLSGVQFAA